MSWTHADAERHALFPRLLELCWASLLVPTHEPSAQPLAAVDCSNEGDEDEDGQGTSLNEEASRTQEAVLQWVAASRGLAEACFEK